MAWTSLTFGYGTQLTSTKMTQLYTNVADLAVRLGGGTVERAVRAGTAVVTNGSTGGSYAYFCGGNIASSSCTAAYTYRFFFTEAQHTNLGYGIIATPEHVADEEYTVTCMVIAKASTYFDIYCKARDQDIIPSDHVCKLSVFVFNSTQAA